MLKYFHDPFEKVNMVYKTVQLETIFYSKYSIIDLMH